MNNKLSPKNLSHYDPQRMTVQTDINSKPWIQPVDYRKSVGRQFIGRSPKDVQGLLKIHRLQNSSPQRENLIEP